MACDSNFNSQSPNDLKAYAKCHFDSRKLSKCVHAVRFLNQQNIQNLGSGTTKSVNSVYLTVY